VNAKEARRIAHLVIAQQVRIDIAMGRLEELHDFPRDDRDASKVYLAIDEALQAIEKKARKRWIW